MAETMSSFSRNTRPRCCARMPYSRDTRWPSWPTGADSRSEIEEVIARIFDGGDYVEFQPEYAPEMLCSNAVLSGHPVAIVANRRGFQIGNRRSDCANFRWRRLCRVSAGIRARDAVLECRTLGTPGGHRGQPARIPDRKSKK